MPSLPNFFEGRSFELVHKALSELSGLFGNIGGQVWCPVCNEPTPSPNVHCPGQHPPGEGRVPKKVHRPVQESRYEYLKPQFLGGNASYADCPPIACACSLQQAVMNLGAEPPSSCSWKSCASSGTRLGQRRATRRRTRRSGREGSGMDEAISNETIVGLDSHDTHPSTPIVGKYCRKPLARSWSRHPEGPWAPITPTATRSVGIIRITTIQPKNAGLEGQNRGVDWGRALPPLCAGWPHHQAFPLQGGSPKEERLHPPEPREDDRRREHHKRRDDPPKDDRRRGREVINTTEEAHACNPQVNSVTIRPSMPPKTFTNDDFKGLDPSRMIWWWYQSTSITSPSWTPW